LTGRGRLGIGRLVGGIVVAVVVVGSRPGDGVLGNSDTDTAQQSQEDPTQSQPVPA
jgi:hypothetical protein